MSHSEQISVLHLEDTLYRSIACTTQLFNVRPSLSPIASQLFNVRPSLTPYPDAKIQIFANVFFYKSSKISMLSHWPI